MLNLITNESTNIAIEEVLNSINTATLIIQCPPELTFAAKEEFKSDVQQNKKITFDLSNKKDANFFKNTLNLLFRTRQTGQGLKPEYLFPLIFMTQVFLPLTVQQVSEQLYSNHVGNFPVIEWSVVMNGQVKACSDVRLFYGSDYELIHPAMSRLVSNHMLDEVYSVIKSDTPLLSPPWGDDRVTDLSYFPRKSTAKYFSVLADFDSVTRSFSISGREIIPEMKYTTFSSIADRFFILTEMELQRYLNANNAMASMFNFKEREVKIVNPTLKNDLLDRYDFLWSRRDILKYSLLGVSAI